MTEKPGLDSIESADQRTCKVVCILTEKEKQTGGSIVKKWKWLLLVGTLIAGCAGCGAQKPEETGAVDIKAVDVVQPESGMDAADAAAEREAEEKNDSYDDLGEKAAEGDVSDFAAQIQLVVAAKDMEGLAKLCAFPLAVEGEVVASEEDFMALGADTVFTEERCEVIKAVDLSALEETMAGVIMGDATPNIIFKSVDGELCITGIN